MADYLDNLTNFWLRAGVRAAAHKATEAEIEAWQRRYQVLLPTDLRDYVTRVNGILGGEHLQFDHEGMSFLPLSSMCLESEWSECGAQTNMFIFADCLLKCYWWCAALDNNPHEHTKIYLCGGPTETNHLIAGSLGEFLDLYMNQHASIHFPDLKRSRG